MQSKGGHSANDSWKTGYEPPTEVHTKVLSSIPASWTWATIDELALEIDYGSSAKTSDNPDDIPVLRMGNIGRGQLQFDNLKYLPHGHPEFPDLLLQPGDLLFNRTNSPELVGKSAVYTGTPAPCSFASYLIRVRPIFYSPHLLCHYINSPFGRTWVASVVAQQVGQANVNGSKLKALAVPVPPLDEQHALEIIIGKFFATIESVRKTYSTLEKQLQELDQSLLSKAFRGELVPQDPNDEPASVLLERIRAEREAVASNPKQRRSTKAPGHKTSTRDQT
jgi:type I restriction enzyme S subunit